MKPLIVLLIASLWIVSCASKKEEKPKPAGAAKSTLIGIIEMVNPEQNYVLIRCDQIPAIQPGTELSALSSEGKKTKLILTPERKGHYLTADIKEGSPEVTNLVLWTTGPDATPALTAPTPAVTPAIPNTGRSPSMSMPMLPDIPLSLLDPQFNQSQPSKTPAAPPTAPTEPLKLDDLEPVVNGDAKP
jgi:hypothetical protein